ncbi:hypothetical protein V8F06_013413 [Rhypophila decipiens]
MRPARGWVALLWYPDSQCAGGRQRHCRCRVRGQDTPSQTEEANPKAELPSVKVYYKLAQPRTEQKPFKDLDQMGGKVDKTDYSVTKELDDGKKADSFNPNKPRVSEIEVKATMKGSSTNPYAIDAGYLTEGEWAEVMRNCGVMHGWIVDMENNRIVRAPKPAFRLRMKVPTEPPIPAPDEQQPEKAQPPTVSPLESAKLRAQELRKKVGNWADGGSHDPNGSTAKVTGSEPVPTKDQKEPQKPTATATTTTAATATTTSATTSATTPLPIRRAVKEIASVLPSFQVNDDSRVEVIVSSHEFETSMARNDFSSTSTEASMSGGFGGFAASVTVGRESQKSSGSKITDNSYEKTMFAKYMIPRTDIYLPPDDLEPTPELQEAIERIRTHKNVADLRRLQRDFGQLWCQQVTLGGRLQSSKTMSDTSKTSEQQQKEAFKWSVGSQVTTPWASASVKHTEASGSSTEESVTDVIKKEKNVFEAVGGDTILVTKDPELWAASVADFRTWRVIDRGSLSSLVDALSAIEGYDPVRSWFMQALPTFSQYIELPPSREVTVRLKVNSPTTQLSLAYLAQMDTTRVRAGGTPRMDPVYYFGRTDDCLVNPVENSVNMQESLWSQLDMKGAMSLFSPREYRAPVLRGFQGDQALSDQDFTNTLWTISAPFNEALQHQALVIIQTVPAPTTTTVPAPGATTNMASAPDNPINTKTLSLGVFRNQQGVLLPCLTDSSTAGQQFWRILKTNLPLDPSRNITSDKDRPFIQQGDEVSLVWYLADQTAGFRDFQDDMFGRRRFATDLKDESRLFLMLPWPRFEALQPEKNMGEVIPPKSNIMIMSGALNSTTDAVRYSAGSGVPLLSTQRTLPSIARAREFKQTTRMEASDESVIAVQQVTFRLDVVDGVRGGSVASRRGDLDDGLVPGDGVTGAKGKDDSEPILIHWMGKLVFMIPRLG